MGLDKGAQRAVQVEGKGVQLAENVKPVRGRDGRHEEDNRRHERGAVDAEGGPVCQERGIRGPEVQHESEIIADKGVRGVDKAPVPHSREAEVVLVKGRRLHSLTEVPTVRNPLKAVIARSQGSFKDQDRPGESEEQGHDIGTQEHEAGGQKRESVAGAEIDRDHRVVQPRH